MRKRVRNPLAEISLAVLIVAIAAGLYFQRREARRVDANTTALASGFAQLQAQHSAEDFDLEVADAQTVARIIRLGGDPGGGIPKLDRNIAALSKARALPGLDSAAQAEADRDLRTLERARGRLAKR
jgi:hypothetical protein